MNPPPEIYLEMSIAERAWNQLERMGCRVHFDADSTTHRAWVEVDDLSGNRLFAVRPSDVLALATGLEACDLSDSFARHQDARPRPRTGPVQHQSTGLQSPREIA